MIGVLDLLGGRAVHACGGVRERYSPVSCVGRTTIDPGDPLALAGVYVERLGLTEIYVAELDAILHGHRSANPNPEEPTRDGQLRRLCEAAKALGAPLWLDSGSSSVDEAHRVLDRGATHVVVGLETLSSFNALRGICDAVGGERVAFSLDLREGSPVVASDAIPFEAAELLAARAVAAGARTVIVLDFARIGSDAGLDLVLIGQVRDRVPGARLLVGGGVRGFADLTQLADVGCDGALVATALHRGALSAADVAAAGHLPCR